MPFDNPTSTLMTMRKLSLLIPCMLAVQLLAAQVARPAKESDDYYQVFEEKLTGRVYLAKKYTSLFLGGPEGIQDLRYKPNTLTTLGVNASYKSLSLSLGTGFGFLNPHKDARGKTRSFDFQTHIYPRDWVTDIYAQFYKGYYLNVGAPPGTNDKTFETRPDIRARLVGISVYRLFNGQNFSYRAGFLQTEWQKKSAGSFLLGAEIYYGSVKGDSALVPTRANSFYPQQGVKRFRLLEFGPGAGYAYTFVFEEHLFATGSLTFNSGLSLVKEEGINGSANRTTLSPNATFRGVIGYNSEEWAVTASLLHNTTNAKGRSSNELYSLRTGDFRITIAKRFTPGKRLKTKLDTVIEKIP
ncbi:MAG: DUF4421 domain-containing protein [Chitinophagaceae bacterium]|nr:MAG: DUF4421 domain-containing protein [Chitinophagaceae bacterium]